MFAGLKDVLIFSINPSIIRNFGMYLCSIYLSTDCSPFLIFCDVIVTIFIHKLTNCKWCNDNNISSSSLFILIISAVPRGKIVIISKVKFRKF